MAEPDGVTIYCPQDACAPYIGFTVEVPPEHMAEALRHPDAVQAALELGRLDMVSILLAMIGVVAIFGGIFAFGYLRGLASAIAKKEAEEIAERRLTELLKNIEEQIDGIKRFGNETKQPAATPPVEGADEAVAGTEFDRDGGRA
ncbi:hypothetical protein [Parvibaculum sp.]|uniref:hypothetical protein n=1 Tax=Parvibaculum sp. TaxID=2024848 RepID=UPI003296BF13